MANTLLLNIPFIEHALVYLSFIPIGFSFFEKVQMRFSKVQITLFVSMMTAVIAIHHLFHLLTGNSIQSVVMYALPLVTNETELSLYVGLLVWLPTSCLTGWAAAKAFSSDFVPKSRSEH